MGSENPVVGYLARVPLFARCSEEELEALATRAMDAAVDEGQVIILEGQGAYEFFAVVSGRAQVTREGRVVAELGPGEFFGELALLDRALRDATVTAMTPMELVVMTGWDLEEALLEAPSMTRSLLAGMARRMRELLRDAT